MTSTRVADGRHSGDARTDGRHSGMAHTGGQHSGGARTGGRHGASPKPRGRTAFIVALATLLTLAVIAVLTWNFATFYPSVVKSGANTCWLGRYALADQGFDGIGQLVERAEGMPAMRDVVYFEAEVDGAGVVTGFTLSLDTFDADGAYQGLAALEYADRTLTYTPPQPDTTGLVHEPNPNSELPYLGGLLKRIPLARQIAVSELDRFSVRYQPHTLIDAGTPLLDGRNGATFPVLGPEEYDRGDGGVSDGTTNVVFRLYDGQSIVEGRQYLYVFDPVAPEVAVGNQQAFMEDDYRIRDGLLQLTRDYGQSWIDAGLTQQELADTLEFYGTAATLPPESLFVVADDALPLAVMYGAAPLLSLSQDGGSTWSDIPFPTAEEFGRAITRRAVGFASAQEGFVALGTDWSMGAGEHKMCYLTVDGGRTWSPHELPNTMTSNTFLDMAMADGQTGLLALDAGADQFLPLVFATTDGANSWEQLEMPFGELPNEVSSLATLDSLTFDGATYTLVMGQGDAGTAKATFQAESVGGPWRLVEVGEGAVHSVG